MRTHVISATVVGCLFLGAFSMSAQQTDMNKMKKDLDKSAESKMDEGKMKMSDTKSKMKMDQAKMKMEKAKVKMDESKMKMDEGKMKMSDSKSKMEEKVKVDHDKMKMDHDKMKMDKDKMAVDHDKMKMDHEKMKMDKAAMAKDEAAAGMAPKSGMHKKGMSGKGMHAGAGVQVKVGDTGSFSVPDNGGSTGYTQSWSVSDETVANVSVGERMSPKNKMMVGAPSVQQYNVKGLKKGTSVVTFFTTGPGAGAKTEVMKKVTIHVW